MKTHEIRAAYLDFFAARGHRVVPSSSLVPANDPTLLFTNSGMVQFKDALTGRERLSYARAVSCQRCMRAGGKHNDLENVGYTGRHQTLFEMLGNFSFGDYFKEEAIVWAWEFVTGVLKLPKERLWVTVHPEDEEARRLWLQEIRLDAERVVPHPDNFWAMGDTGPCGPDSEIFYDLGPSVPGGPPGSADEEGDRYSEIWNLVFPQFDRAADGTLTPLESPGVDTGMGLERIATVVQGGHSNYDNDLFRGLIDSVAALAAAGERGSVQRDDPSLRVIADHVRAAAFLVADGVPPGREDRGYVVRRIVRRALRHGDKLGIRGPFLARLAGEVATVMGDAYPELHKRERHIADTLAAEEERFAETLKSGMAMLNRTIAELGDAETIPGDVVFKLYDTYGFPVDMTADVARERGLAIDEAGFEREMAGQRARGRAAARFDASLEQQLQVEGEANFTGYGGTVGEASIVALFADGKPTPSLAAGQHGVAVLNATPFYAEAGGQVGDSGELANDQATFAVRDTTKGGGQHLHHGTVQRGTLRQGDTVTATVDAERRQDVARNHSATHLLHAALRQTLGATVEQKGSLVAPDRLRFDFSHTQPVAADELAAIDALVNAHIRDNAVVATKEMPYPDAVAAGALALFGERYADRVRVLSMGDDFSVELCGGTHVARAGDIGLLRIVGEEGIAAGVRRIEAVTGRHALAWIAAGERELGEASALLRSGRLEVAAKVRQLADQAKALQRQVSQLQEKVAASHGADLAAQAVDVNGVSVLAAAVDGDPKALPATMDNLRDRLGDSVVVLAHAGPRISLVTGVSRSMTERVSANELVRFVGAQVGAKGGGRPDMARAGGGDQPAKLAPALASVAEWVRERTAA